MKSVTRMFLREEVVCTSFTHEIVYDQLLFPPSTMVRARYFAVDGTSKVTVFPASIKVLFVPDTKGMVLLFEYGGLCSVKNA